MENDNKAMSTKELTAVVQLLLEREESREARTLQKRKRRIRRRLEEKRESIERLQQSIETIKWCIVGITSVMALSLLILVMVVWQIGNEAQRIQGEVQQIRTEAEKIVVEISSEAEKIRERLQNPLRSIGGAIGGQLDEKIGGLLGVEEE